MKNLKKTVCIIMCFLTMLCFVSCGGNVRNARTREVASELYSQKEINAAIRTIKMDFAIDWSGCTLTEIYYAGDDYTKRYQDFADRNNADDVIVLLSTFTVDSSGGDGSLIPNYTYEKWEWILVRNKGGHWKHVDHGY